MAGANAKERNNLLRKLNLAVQDFERTKLFKDWEEWLSLTHNEQMNRRSVWDKYYADVRETVIYAIFVEQKEAAKQNNWAKVKELAATTRKMREDGHTPELPKPKFRDPFDFENEMRQYWSMKKKVRELMDYPDVGNASPSEIFNS